MVVSVLSWIAIGLLVSLLATRALPGRESGGALVTILIGVAGALIGGFVDYELGRYRSGGGAGWIAVILGAVVLLTVYRLFMRSRENP